MRILRVLFRLALLLVLLIPLCAAGAFFLAVDRRPTVDREAEFTPDNIERATRILKANDPRTMRTGAIRTITVTAGDLDLAANYLAHRYARGAARVQLESERARLTLSVPAPQMFAGYFLNIETVLAQDDPLPRIEQVRVGRLPIPVGLARASAARLSARWIDAPDVAVYRDAIKSVAIRESQVALTYEWREGLRDTVRSAFVSDEDRERLRAYQDRLVEATNAFRGRTVSLADLLMPVFTLAQDRSRAGDPVAENRAAILILTFFVDGRSLSQAVPEAREWPRPRRVVVTLSKRDDFSKHFMISAALAANTGGPFADAVGLYKEVADSRGGSGFSFNDLAADRAGRRLGERAEEGAFARTLQQRLSRGLTDGMLMPDASDLPEFMPEAEFTRRFGGIGAPAYNRMMDEIDRGVAALPLYR